MIDNVQQGWQRARVRWLEECELDRRRRAGEFVNKEPMYARARAAARRGVGRAPTAEAVQWQKHVVDLAEVEPRAEIHWLAPGTTTTSLVTPAGGVCVRGASIYVAPIVSRADEYIVVLHELGHARTNGSGQDNREEVFKSDAPP